jgi:hypothetical protein
MDNMSYKSHMINNLAMVLKWWTDRRKW